jgi:hypothetical protein
MKMSEELKNPKRYNQGKIECWDYIIDQDMNYLEGNIIKYVTRYKHKNGLEDLEKAKVYIDKLMDHIRSQEWKKAVMEST